MSALLLMLALWQAPAQPTPGATYCPPRKRSAAAVHRFEQATGHPKGWPGHVVDHVVPLCACGVDGPSNYQWQTLRRSYAKDKRERALCRKLKQATPAVGR